MISKINQNLIKHMNFKQTNNKDKIFNNLPFKKQPIAKRLETPTIARKNTLKRKSVF